MCTVRTEDSENGAVCMCNCVKHETLCDVVILRIVLIFPHSFPTAFVFQIFNVDRKVTQLLHCLEHNRGIYYVFKMSANIDMKKGNAV